MLFASLRYAVTHMNVVRENVTKHSAKMDVLKQKCAQGVLKASVGNALTSTKQLEKEDVHNKLVHNQHKLFNKTYFILYLFFYFQSNLPLLFARLSIEMYTES